MKTWIASVVLCEWIFSLVDIYAVSLHSAGGPVLAHTNQPFHTMTQACTYCISYLPTIAYATCIWVRENLPNMNLTLNTQFETSLEHVLTSLTRVTRWTS